MTWTERLAGLWPPAKAWYDGHSTRDRRVVGAVLAAIVLSLVYVVVVEPIRDWRRAVADEIEEGLERLERSQRLVAALDDLRAEHDDLKAQLGRARKRLLPGGSGTLGAAALQERANDLAATHGVIVRTAQVMREEPADPYRKVAVRLTLSGELGPVALLLAGLEYGGELSVPFMEISRRGASARSTGPRTLSSTVEVAGFIASDAGVAAEVAGAEAAAVAAAELVGPLPPGARERDDFVGPPPPASVEEAAT
jgi:type II secretory pathway component PulM